MSTRSWAPIVAVGATFLLAACGSGRSADEIKAPSSAAAVTTAYALDLPAGFPQPRIPQDNPLSQAKIALGRTLFYDRRMSVNGQHACATCHEQRYAFSDRKAIPRGATGQLHTRNAMQLGNVVYNLRYNWSNPNLTSLRQQALAVMLGETPIELGWPGHDQEILHRFRSDAQTLRSFEAAFPGEADPVTLNNVAKAIAAFESTLMTGRSAYDEAHDRQHPRRAAMSEAAWRGVALFFSDRLACSQCHGGFNFSNAVVYQGSAGDRYDFRNNGLYNLSGGQTPDRPLPAGNFPVATLGLFEFTGKPQDMGRMRVPSLRNIALTAPYMHDGSIATLREVIVDHYARGGRRIAGGANAGDGAKSPYKDALITGFAIREGEVDDLLAFLDSLTDWQFICDPDLSDPFGRIPMHEHCGASI